MLKEDVGSLPKSPGVYIFKDLKKRVLYVGKAVSLHDRVASYFQAAVDLGPKTRALVGKIASVDHINVSSELEALLLEADLIKRLRPPYNISLKDDKYYQYIRVEKPLSHPPKQPVPINEKTDWKLFPAVGTARRPDLEDKSALYFGPFPQGQTVQYVLRSLRQVFGLRDAGLSRSNLASKLGRTLFFKAEVSPAEYHQSLRRLISFLKSGQKDPIILGLKKQMSKLSKEQHFEEAGRLRDQIERFEYVTQNFRPAQEFLANPNLIEDTRNTAVARLAALVGAVPSAPTPFRLEAYDISHFAGKRMVGSLVVFIDGVPSKKDYRRFRIKTVGQVDDTAALREVLRRRFKNDWPLPQVLLVDGGKPQVSAARQVLVELNLTAKITLVGLAKRHEELITARGATVRLPKSSPALNLLQQLRNEAHRFANSYRKKLL
jgi:excinuclease ABC subunit C